MNLPSTNTLWSDLSEITNVFFQAIFCQIRMVWLETPKVYICSCTSINLLVYAFNLLTRFFHCQPGNLEYIQVDLKVLIIKSFL